MKDVGFCLSIDHGGWSRGDASRATQRTIDLALLVDEAGFDSIWLTEDPDGWDAYALLGAISQQTRNLRLGTGVTNAFHRNPNQIAASIATLDRLSGGRAFLGIGRGQPEIYQNVFGLDSSDPLGRLADAIGLVRQWWSGEGLATGYGLVEGAEWRRTVLPIARPPIYVAAVGPKALRLAGQVADGVLFNELATPGFVRIAVETACTAARNAGRNPDDLSFFVNPAITVTDDPEPVLERKKGMVTLIHALPGMDRLLTSETWDVPGIMSAVRELMRTDAILAQGGHFFEMRRDGDLEHARQLIPSGLIDEASAIGPVDHVRARIDQFLEAGATHLFVDRRGLPADAHELSALLEAIVD